MIVSVGGDPFSSAEFCEKAAVAELSMTRKNSGLLLHVGCEYTPDRCSPPLFALND